MPHGSLMVFTGNANPKLGADVTRRLGISLGSATVGRFSDGEVTVEVHQNVRARDVFVVQSTCAPTNENLMELLIMVDALKRASAERISAVIPYYGYARQDRRPRSSRVPISAKVVANLLETVGVARVLTMDLHADQVHGFFSVPVDHLTAVSMVAEHFRNRYDLSNMVAVATDAGGAKRTGRFSEKLGIPMAIIDKRRVSDTAVKQGHVVGEVAGRDVVIFEDEIATAGTLVSSVATLKAAGARTVHAAATHGVLCGPAIERLRDAAIDSIVVTNTVNLPADKGLDKLTVLNVAPLFAAAIERIHSGQSVGVLFE